MVDTTVIAPEDSILICLGDRAEKVCSKSGPFPGESEKLLETGWGELLEAKVVVLAVGGTCEAGAGPPAAQLSQEAAG